MAYFPNLLRGTQDNGTIRTVPVTGEGHVEVAIHGPRLPFGSANDQVIWSTTVAQDGQFAFAFSDEVTLQPGETVTLAVRSVTATATCVGQLNTREDQ